MSNAELACTYAALILHDGEVEISAEKIQALLTAANVKADAYWAGLFAKLAANTNIGDLLSAVGSAAPAAAAAAPAAAAAAPAAGGKAAAPAKEEKKEESDQDMGFGLFD